MDTIVYVCYECKRTQEASAECKYTLKEHILQDYRVIKILVQEKVLEPENVRGRETIHSKKNSRRASFSLLSLGRRLRSRRCRRLAERSRQCMCEALKQELAPLLQEYGDNFVCYDASVSLAGWVHTMLPMPEFEDWTEYQWVQRLLRQATCHDFVVLGDRSYLRQILWELAPRMKSLLWIAPDRTVEDGLEEFAEDFYQETGLAIRLQFLQAGTTYGQLIIPDFALKVPVNILDFSGGRHIPKFYPVKGSKWIDVLSDEEKARRICARGLSCELISLRKQWKNL